MSIKEKKIATRDEKVKNVFIKKNLQRVLL